jgi:hypothetical protein
MFPNGAIWGAFLLHIAKPNVYPIGLGDHPKPANGYHLKTGQRE